MRTSKFAYGVSVATVAILVLFDCVWADFQQKNSSVVLSTRGVVSYKRGSKPSYMTSPTPVRPLKSFQTPGCFCVEPNSEVIFFHFPSSNRVRIQVPAQGQTTTVYVKTESIQSDSPYVIVEKKTNLSTIGGEATTFRSKIGAASSRTTGMFSLGQVSGQATVHRARLDKVLELYTTDGSPSFKILQDVWRPAAGEKFYSRVWTPDYSSGWQPSNAEMTSSNGLLVFRPHQALEPGQRIDFVSSTSPPQSNSSNLIMVARLGESASRTLESIHRQAKSFDERMEYFAALAELRLYDQAELELRQLTEDFPDQTDWKSISESLVDMRASGFVAK
jgi:hypothetical protein